LQRFGRIWQLTVLELADDPGGRLDVAAAVAAADAAAGLG